MNENNYRNYTKADNEMSLASYNAVIGGVLLWGFALSAVIVWLAGDYFLSWNPFALIIVYLIVSFIGAHISHTSTDPIISFIGYNLVVLPFGLVLSVILYDITAVSILHALAVTAGVMLAMILLSTAVPRIFLRMGGILLATLATVIIIEILCLVFGWYHPTVIDWIIVIAFSLYIGYDWAVAQEKPHTLNNAIDSCVDLYIDAVNMFARIASIDDDR